MKHLAKIAAAIAVVSLIGAGCAKKPAPAPANSNAPVGESMSKPAQGEFVIHIKSDNSFDPTTVYVKVGTKVTWVNDDTDPHMLRANPHPSHDSNPTFGPRDPLQPGESWSFTFDRTERFLYHDHLNPAFGGAVDVQ
jgi:plastocyanin